MARESDDDQRRLEKARGKGDRKDWFEEELRLESRKMDRWSVNNCGRNEVNPAISAKGTIPDNN